MNIKTLIEDYQGRIDTVNSLLEDKQTALTKHRLETKRGCFKTFISELQKCEFENTNNLDHELKAPSNWVIFVVIQRILGFPSFLTLATFGVIILLIKFMFNYVKYGGEAIS